MNKSDRFYCKKCEVIASFSQHDCQKNIETKKKLSDKSDPYFNRKGKIKWRYKSLNYWDALNKLFLYKYCSGAVIGLVIFNHFKFTIIELIITGFALGMFLACMHEKPIN